MKELTDAQLKPISDFIISFEGFRDKAYKDIGGVWTIGYGFTYYRNRKVKEGDTITLIEARAILNSEVQTRFLKLKSYVHSPINLNHTIALVSFIFNLGTEAFHDSTLLKKINQRLYDEAANEFLKWDHVGKQVVAGLTRRRKAERQIFLTPCNDMV